jgi:hypothetical protein
MVRVSQVTSAEEPDGGNLHVRIWRGLGLGNRPGLLYSSRQLEKEGPFSQQRHRDVRSSRAERGGRARCREDT